MRRSDREMPADWALEVLKNAPFMTLAFIKPNGEPYSLPLSVAVADGKQLYFHCANVGEKLDCIAHNANVSVSAVVKSEPCRVPDNPAYFTLRYESATARGVASIVEDREERIEALRLICERFLPSNMENFDRAIECSLAATTVVRIDLIEAPRGKRRQVK
jgi:hypothetical protein